LTLIKIYSEEDLGGDLIETYKILTGNENIRPMALLAHDPSSPPPRTSIRISNQKLGLCVMRSGTGFFWYQKLGRNRLMFYSAPETWDHMTHIHLSYWSLSFVYILYRFICT